MIQRLSKLHSRLRALRRRRRSVRWSTGYSAMALAVLWLLAALFVADWRLGMDVPQRIVGMVICLGVMAWSFRRYTRPWLGYRETELDMALMVEKQQQIDSDVVAAIQFESPEAPQWGSVRLEEAVIEHTARLGERLNVTEGIPHSPLRHRTIALLLTLAVLGAGVWLFPDYARVFLNRLLLGSLHYPSRTNIEAVWIDGNQVDLSGWRSAAVKVSYAKPVRFEVVCSGDLPESGEVAMTSMRGVPCAKLTLNPAATGEQASNSRRYAGDVAKLVESVHYQVYAGDAWTDPAELLVVPFPAVDVRLDVTPPQYAAGAEASSNPLGLRQVSVLEGSQVTLRITSDKRLRQAEVSIDGQSHALVRDKEQALIEGEECWKLEPAGTPLATVAAELHYAVQATDSDGLQLEQPIRGVIRIKADQPPRVLAAIITKVVLPTAKPTVICTASDDFGLARIAIVPEVIRSTGRSEEREEVVVFRLPEGQQPKLTIREGFHLDLAPLKLVKGDQLKISVRATDYRGAGPGKSSLSEPLVFQVTDEAGILAAISEADKESARQLRIMIERQIDVGEGR